MATIQEEYTVEGHFQGKDASVRPLYNRLLVLLRTFGPVKEEAKKTCIHLVNRTALAGVYTRKDYLLLEFKTDYPLENDKISKSEQISRNRFHHTLRLASTETLDGEVQGWLKDAYCLSA